MLFFLRGERGGSANMFFFLPSHCAFGARSGIVHLHSLPRGKERSKKSELGKPSSQRFCLLTCVSIAQARPQNSCGALPFGNPRGVAALCKPLRCSASLRKARLEDFVQQNRSILSTAVSKMGQAGGGDSIACAFDNRFFWRLRDGTDVAFVGCRMAFCRIDGKKLLPFYV